MTIRNWRSTSLVACCGWLTSPCRLLRRFQPRADADCDVHSQCNADSHAVLKSDPDALVGWREGGGRRRCLLHPDGMTVWGQTRQSDLIDAARTSPAVTHWRRCSTTSPLTEDMDGGCR